MKILRPPKLRLGNNNAPEPGLTHPDNLLEPGSYAPIFENAAFLERFHLIFRQIGIIPSMERPLIIGVTSAIRGEGRTLMALGLATAISKQIPLPVLLLESDLEQPGLASSLGLPAQGLCEYLRGEIGLDEAIKPTFQPDMMVILAGDSKGESLTLLRSERLADLIKLLSQRFGAIVLDTPPLIMMAESTRVISLVDRVLMVAESGRTPANLVKAALAIIPQSKRSGVILNRSHPPFRPFHWLGTFFKATGK